MSACVRSRRIRLVVIFVLTIKGGISGGGGRGEGGGGEDGEANPVRAHTYEHMMTHFIPLVTRVSSSVDLCTNNTTFKNEYWHDTIIGICFSADAALPLFKLRRHGLHSGISQHWKQYTSVGMRPPEGFCALGSGVGVCKPSLSLKEPLGYALCGLVPSATYVGVDVDVLSLASQRRVLPMVRCVFGKLSCPLN